MERQESQNQFSCAMCFFKCHLNDELIRHYVRFHKQDPQFRIRCVYEECGATFHKWKLFTQHFKRQHPNALRMLNNVNQDIENLSEEETLHNNIPMEQESPLEEDSDQGKIIVNESIV